MTFPLNRICNPIQLIIRTCSPLIMRITNPYIILLWIANPTQRTNADCKSLYYFASDCKSDATEIRRNGKGRAFDPLKEKKRRNRHIVCFSSSFGGERGIRTPGPSQVNGFQDRRNRPLCHLSKIGCKNTHFFTIDKIFMTKDYYQSYFQYLIEQ